MTPLEEATHTKWLACSGERWFSLSLAEDWVRLALLAPISSAPLGGVTLHSFGPTEMLLRASIPPYTALHKVLIGATDTVTLSDRLSNKFPLPTSLPLDGEAFWRFVARFALSLALNTAAPRGSLMSLWGTGSTPLGLRPYYDPDAGLGLRLSSAAKKGTLLPRLWGECLPLSTEDHLLLVSIGKASAASLMRGDLSALDHIVVGPLALVNHACLSHANVSPMSGPETPRDPITGLCPEDWTGGTLTQDLQENAALLVSYGDLYVDDDGKHRDLVCMECPWLFDNVSAAAHKAWTGLSNSAWMPYALADDWVTVTVLCPMLKVDPLGIRLHSIGKSRLRLIEDAPSLSSVTQHVRENRAKHTASALKSAFPTPFVFFDKLDKGAFWEHVARFLLALALPGTLRPGLVPVSAGNAIHFAANRVVSREGVVPNCWGKVVPCLEHNLAAIARVDCRTSRCLLRGRKMHVVLGPMSFLPHTCEFHANVRPETSGITSSKETLDSGLSPSDYGGCTAEDTIQAGVVLCYAYDRSAGTSGAPGDAVNLVCQPCLNSGSTPPPTPSQGSGGPSPPSAAGSSVGTPPPKRIPVRAPRVPEDKLWLGDELPPEVVKGAVRKFRVGTINHHLSPNFFHANLAGCLRTMLTLDLSVMCITETLAVRSSVPTDKLGIAERGVITTKGDYKFMSLWSFLPPGKKMGAGCTIVWDARLSYDSPVAHDSGRFCAVTLSGPTGKRVRVIGVYAPATHSPGKVHEIELLRLLASELSACRRTGTKPIVLGDFNDVPGSDIPFNPARVNNYPRGQSLWRHMEAAGMVDSFRARHQ